MKVLYTIFFILWVSPLYAQSDMQQLRLLLTKASADAQKLEAYKNIVYAYESVNEDSAIFYAEQGVEYFTQNKYRNGQAWMLSDLAEIDDDHGREEPAMERSLFALQIFNEENNIHGIAEVNNDLGTIYGKAGDFESSITCFMTALKNFEQEKNSQGIMRVYSNIGITYERYKVAPKALYYLKLADSISRKMPLSDAVINLYNDIGAYYSNRGDTTTALRYFEEGLKKSDKPEYLSVHLSCLINAGVVYCKLGNDKKGMAYLDEALNTARSMKFPEEEANILTNLASILIEKDKVKALSYLEEALAISQKIGNRPLQTDIYDVMTDLYTSQNDYKNAFETREKKQAILDSMNRLNKTKEIAAIGAVYDLERSNHKLKQMEVIMEKNANKRNVSIFITICAVIFLIILAVFSYKTTALNKQLIIHESELKQLNEMKNKLFSIIGHDLRAPIARIPIIIDILEDKETTEEEKKLLLDNMKEHTKVSVETLDKLLFWGQTLVRGVRLNMTVFYPKKYITGDLELKKIAAAEKNITVIDNTPADMAVYADATHFDFIIRNLVVNALKYTNHNGRVEISADTQSLPGFTIFEVKDDGIGIPKEMLPNIFEPLNSTLGTAKEQGTGIGLMLCKEFAKQNGGDIWVESEPGAGTTFFFSVKTSA